MQVQHRIAENLLIIVESLDGKWDKCYGGMGKWAYFIYSSITIAYLLQHGPDLYVLDLIFGSLPGPDVTDDDWQYGKPVESVLKHLSEYDHRCIRILNIHCSYQLTLELASRR